MLASLMKNRDVMSSLFWAGFGIVFCVGGLQHGLTRAGIPGPGCLPFIVGLVLIFLSFVLMISTILGNKQVGKSSPEPRSMKKFWLAVFSLIAYGVALKHLGYLLTTFLFMAFLLRSIEPQRWKITFIWAFLTAFLSWTIFMLLKVELPKGVLGI